ncbi:hypothetical protein GCM10027275_13200 [Rhabdobacter roseus]|uniref:Glutathione synthase/RimK-type ligase-like ATP-grasp enzyme n=1 Tax=Rhabdobacter roseus TaxID=1655419 RepID=A0A840TGE6_9BACT|nr:hypothetical protein [Rhabdobacter roseus]MBB5283236.1 glutathione synthase/RimK-type ligase-like ATP-grasp enzyme [Rhabdobacter roseus]
MKKIGILHGMENTFPQAFVERVNSKGEKDIVAEAVSIDQVVQAKPTDYAVIIDRISQDVPFYRAYLKNAALCGTAVINNPFWWSADEKFFNNCLAEQIGVPVPKTVLLPSHERPTDTGETSFRNLAFPLAWEAMFEYVGFPAYMKPHAGGGWKSVYQVNDPQDLWNKHGETGQLVMMLQEEIKFEDYFRCYCIGQKDVRIMPYEPRNPHHLRYAAEMKATGPAAEKLLATIHDYVLRLNLALGYDFNTVEFAVRDGIPIAIDFCNPAPDADVYSVGHDNFEWVVETAANMAIERAKKQQPGKNNLTWGTFVRDAAFGNPNAEQTPEVPAPAQKPKAAKPTVVGKEPKAAPPVPVSKVPKAAKVPQEPISAVAGTPIPEVPPAPKKAPAKAPKKK